MAGTQGTEDALVSTGVTVHPLTSAVGAVIEGPDLRETLDASVIAAIRQALCRHGVVFFRDQDISGEQQVALARCFGEVQLPLFENTATETPGLTVIEQTSPKGSGTDVWHADSTFMTAPPLGAILRAVRVPRVGGDTLWADMCAAYESLSSRLQRLLDGLTAVHSTAKVAALVSKLDNAYANSMAVESVVHPVVRVHPETGRKLVFVSSNWTERIVELGESESATLLDHLYSLAAAPEVQCRFRWEPHSIAFWDNRSTQHYAVPDYAEPRTMRRVMIRGDVPFGPAADPT